MGNVKISAVLKIDGAHVVEIAGINDESPQQLKSVAGKRIGNYNGIRYYRMQNKHRGR